jgi:predicted dienelactone hydrolase
MERTLTAGCRSAVVRDAPAGRDIPVLVMYPSDSPEKPAHVGPYAQRLALHGRIAAGTFPLVIVSHGSGGSPLVYRTLAAHLARHGYVVALPEHPGNNRADNTLADTVENLERRPRDVSAVIDWVLGSSDFASRCKPQTAALVGHSLGGYTALAVAGGVPTSFAHESADREPRRIELTPDGRVKALVLLAPATPWFMHDGALARVGVPNLMLIGEKDDIAPDWHGEIVRRGVPDPARVAYLPVPNAGHFAFVSPFPPAMTDAAFAPSQDPPGFDRRAFHVVLNATVLAFLNRVV